MTIDYATNAGGDVFPKLNWSAPRDATWISCDKTLKCKFVSDILLLVKSSDFALRDLTQPFLHCEDAAEVDERAEQLFLVLRQWRGDIVPNSGSYEGGQIGFSCNSPPFRDCCCRVQGNQSQM